MDLIADSWNQKTYQEFIEFLKSYQDLEYRNFHSSLVLNTKYEMIGIRLPILRKIAKTISKGNMEAFLNCVKSHYYEEVMIEGLVISLIKDESVFSRYYDNYIQKIDNWALCDCFCNSIAVFKNYGDKYFKKAIRLSLNNKEFISRVGIVTILNYFIKADNLESIYTTLNRINSDKFYINMAEAWLICELYIKYPNETKKFLMNNNLNDFTQNKAISKIHDSYRVSKKGKEELNNFKRRNNNI